MNFSEISANPTDFVMILILKTTYVELSKIASKKGVTVPHVIAEALARFIDKEKDDER